MTEHRNELGEAIRKRLRALSMSQKDFAAHLGWDEFFVSKVIRGKAYINKRRRKRASKVLGVNLDGLEQLKYVREHERRRTPTESEAGRLIRAALQQKGLTQGDLARELGVGSGYISHVILGRVHPKKQTCERINAVLGVDVISVDVSRRRPSSLAVGQRIRLALQQKGLTQIDFARELGISRTSVSRIILGRIPISKRSREKIVAFLGEDILRSDQES